MVGRVSVDVRDDQLVVESHPESEKLLPATVEDTEAGPVEGRWNAYTLSCIATV